MATVDCICPPNKAGETRHPDGDTIELRERLDFASGRTARNFIAMGKQEDKATAEIMTDLTQWYMLAGIRTWTVVDAYGKPVEPNRITIPEYLFSHPEAAEIVGDEADDLYSEAVIAPLVVRGSSSMPPMPMGGSTSATNGSSSKPPKPSKRSSTTTTPTDDIETTSLSLVGASSSSLNSE